MPDRFESSTVPERPDAGPGTSVVPAPVPRKHMSGGAIAAIVIACVVAVAGVALVIVLAVNSVGNSAGDQFKQIQYCMDHPRVTECNPSTFSP